MKKAIFIFYLITISFGSLWAGLTQEQVQELAAKLPFEVRDAYNRKKEINFMEHVRISRHFTSVFTKKVKELSSLKISYQPKLQGWTALVFKTIYESAKDVPQLPAQIKKQFSLFSRELVSAVNSFCAEVLTPCSSFRIAPLCAAVLFLTSILPIHKIKFRLLIQRE